MPVLHGEVALLGDTLTLNLLQDSQETDLGAVVWMRAEVFWESLGRLWKRPAQRTRLREGLDLRTVPAGRLCSSHREL